VPQSTETTSSATPAIQAVPAGSIQAWMTAIRPRSLPIAVGPVLVGASFGYLHSGAIDPVAALLAFAAALLMQVITNMQNDVGYTVRGGERSGTRTGLPRATANGWLSIRQVRAGIVVTALLATAIGVALVAWRGWPVLAIGVASLLAALAYMGGPKPIAYTPFGELTVFIFFGLVAVLGTDWLLTGAVSQLSFLAAVCIGSLSAAALAVNNHRDIAHDRQVGRQTFAASFGAGASHAMFAALLFGPFLLLAPMALMSGGATLLLPALLVPTAWRLRRDFVRCPAGTAYNAVLFRTFLLELWFAGLLSAGALLAALHR